MFQEEAEVRLKVNSKEAVDKLNDLEAEAERLRKKFNECFRKGDTRGIAKTSKELEKVNKAIRNMRTNAANIKAAMKRLDEASPKELRRTIKMINDELNSGRVKRGSKEWDQYVEQLRRAKSELAKVNAEMQANNEVMKTASAGLSSWATGILAAVGGLTGITAASKAAVNAYAEMQAEEANVRKYTGMTAEEVAILNEEFKKMDTRTSREELNRLAQEAGRLGKTSVEDVLGFVKAADQINVALDDLGDGATLTLSKLTGIFGDEQRLGTERSLLAVGSVINELSQNCSASAPYLADFSKRLAGVGAQANMTIPQIMAFAAVLDTQGQAVEMSATAFSQLILKLYKDPSKFAKAAGLDVTEFATLLKRDANEAVLTLLEALKKLGNIDALAPIFKEMGMDGARASGVMAALAGNIDAVRAQQIEANKAFREATSVTTEFGVQNTTVQAGLDKEQKKLHEIAVELGKQLLPAVRGAITGTAQLLSILNTFVSFVVKHKTAIFIITSAIAGYTLAVKANTIATAAHTATTKLASIATTTWAAGVNLAKAAFYALTGNMARAAVSMRAFNAAIMANPIGLIIGGITALISYLVVLNDKSKQQKEEMKRQREEAEAFRRSIRDLDDGEAQYSQNQLGRLRALYTAATDETKAQKERIAAVKELQKLYPDYFGNLSAEIIMAGNATAQYNALTTSIRDAARARAAMDKIAENEGKVIDNEGSIKTLDDEFNAIQKEIDNELTTANQQSYRDRNGKKHYRDSAKKHLERVKELRKRQKEINEELKGIYDQNEQLDAASDELARKYGDANKIIPGEGNPITPTGTPTVDPAEQRKLEAERKRAMDKELDTLKGARDKEQAINLAAYNLGNITRSEYLEKNLAIEQDAIDKQLAVLEKYGQKDSSKYGQLLEQREQLQEKYNKESLGLTIKELEAEATERKRWLTEAFYDPNSPLFQNVRAFNQALLDEDLRFLTEKRDLYKEGSEEWLKVQQEIDRVNAEDRIAKQKELAETLMQYSQEYRQKERQAQLDDQKSLLDQLHTAGLISEEDYQRALQAIRRKYRQDEKADTEKAKQERYKAIEDTYKDASDILANSTDPLAKGILTLMESWDKLMDDIANGEDIWTNLGDVATQALSLIGGMMSQVSAYANAERDAELAKIEKHYDDEIKAAGKNTKKKERLEKEKEEATAKIKKRYNDRAMKMEIAQAIAQSAINALLGYQAGLKFPFPASTFMPPILAGLAVAQGAIQIATIKKQHEAQAAGYYEGGFTGGRNYRREAGVVHEGEFIANHYAVNNGNLSPLFALLDAAQRNNTVGSLTAEDVSIALAQGRGVSARGEVAAAMAPTVITTTIDTAPIDTLNAILDRGINAVVVIDGEDGFHQKYTHYQKLINNPRP